MKIALFKYSNTTNIGDNIQTMAVAQHIDQAYDLVDRDFLHQYTGEPIAVVMQGWFTHEPQNWPPAAEITPIFFGFHMTAETASSFAHHIDYFRRFAPIGCRDETTAEKIRSWGVDAYFSGCATMTFPERASEPKDPKLILVDQSPRHFLSRERRGHVSITHTAQPYMSDHLKLQATKELLSYYRDNAGFVITSRIHCAMPCAAMGIPVVYTGIREGRTQIVDMIGIPTIQTKRFPRTRLADLPVQKPAFDEMKKRITADLHARLAMYGVKTRPAAGPPQSQSGTVQTGNR